jgi:hypothetical protein
VSGSKQDKAGCSELTGRRKTVEFGEGKVLLSHIKGEIVSWIGWMPCHRVVELTCVACDVGVLHTREEDSS